MSQCRNELKREVALVWVTARLSLFSVNMPFVFLDGVVRVGAAGILILVLLFFMHNGVEFVTRLINFNC